MKVRARYFALLREAFGKAEEEREVTPGTTARQLFEALGGPAGGTSGGTSGGSRLAGLAASMGYAVNMEHVAGDTVLTDGDEVAFLPPVSGG